MRLLLHDHLIADLLRPLSQANSSLMERFEGRQVVRRSQPHGAGDAFVRVVTLPKYDKPSTATDRQGLPTDSLAHELNLWIISLSITFDYLAGCIDRPARERCPLQCFSHFCSSHPGIDLRHAHGVMAKKTPDYFQGD